MVRTFTGNDGTKRAEINFEPVSPEMVPQIALDPRAEYVVTPGSNGNEVKVTEDFAGGSRTRVVSYNSDTKTTRDITTTTSNTGQTIIRTSIVTQLGGELGGGGTMTWSGSTPDKPGTVVIKDAQGETFTGLFSEIDLSGQTFTSSDENTFTSADGTITVNLAEKKVTKTEVKTKSDGARTEVSFAPNPAYGAAAGDRTVVTRDKGDKQTRREVYHIGGDLSQTTFENGAEVYTQRVTEQRAGIAGRLVSQKYPDGDIYRPVHAVLYDTPDENGKMDGKITKEDAQRLGIDTLNNNIFFESLDALDGESDGNVDEDIIIIGDNPGKYRLPRTEEELKRAGEVKTSNSLRESLTGNSPLGEVGNFFSGYRPKQGVSNLLFGKAFLNEWREKVDEGFAKAYLGIDYWTSEICSSEFDVVGDSVAGITAAEGVFQFIGVAQGEVAGSVPILCDAQNECKAGTCRRRDNVCVDGQDKIILEHFYKITYGVRAPSDERFTPYYDEEGAISFNIVVSGKDKTASLFTQFVDLQNGESAVQRAPKKSPILHYSPIVYDKVCLVFGKKPVDRKGKNVDSVCNPIVPATGSFENFRRNIDGAPRTSGREPLFNKDW